MRQMARGAVKGLYAITPDASDTGWLVEKVEQALAGGARLVQYRNKSAPWRLRKEQARALLSLCVRHAAQLIVNDSPELAAEIGADGVHLGRDDPAPESARALLGDTAIVGVSCYGDIARARKLLGRGASYCAFGRFFASDTKPQAAPATLSLLHRARVELDAPLVAIGGITADNAEPLISAGADAIAVCGGLFHSEDTRGSAEKIASLFRSYSTVDHARQKP
jgi:thiamine-phosphate pyrophosphorylase